MASRMEHCLKVFTIRYILAILGSIAMGVLYGFRVNISVSIVNMVNHTALAHEGVSSSNKNEEGPFVWNPMVQGVIKSSYFWGYLVAQLPGGIVAESVSAKWVMFFSVFINIICTILSPVSAYWHYGMFVAMRILEGIGGGVAFPAMHVMLAKWAPLGERSVMSTIVYAGTALGTVIYTLITGIICSKIGWEASFYIGGGCPIIWLILWSYIVSDSPNANTLISEEEKNLIASSLNAAGNAQERKRPPIPWKAIFTSPPFLAILVIHTCGNWGWYMILTELPNYMKMILKYKMADNAIVSSVPYFTMWIYSMILGKLLDKFAGNKKITITIARKIASVSSCIIPLLCFLVICYSGPDRTLVVILMTIAITAMGGMFSGYLSNHIDISPNFAGTLMAITNTIATIPGIVEPIIVGKLMEMNPTIQSWQIVFWVTITLYATAAFVYTIFGSGDEQKWNKPDET